VISAAVVLLLMIVGFAVQQRVTTSAFDRLEADQVAQDAQRVRIGLESWVTLLRNYGATNSIWDASHDDVARADRTAFASDFPASDVRGIYGLDGVLGVGPDGTPRVGGLVVGDSYVPAPDGLADAADLRTLFDPAAKAGQARCGVVSTAAGPFLFCGFAAHRSDGGDDVAGGLIYLRSMAGPGLAVLARQITMPITPAPGPPPAAGATTSIESSLGRLQVTTRVASGSQMTLSIVVPTVTDRSVTLQALRPRPIHQHAATVARWLMLLMAVLGSLLFVAVVLIMRREVRRQVAPLRRTTDEVIRSGDRSLRIASTAGGEIGGLAAGIDSMLNAMATQDADLRAATQDREAQLLQSQLQQRLAGQHVRQRAQQAINETARAVVAELEDVIREAETVKESVSGIDDRVRATTAVTSRVHQHAAAGARTAEAVTESLQQVSGIAQLIAAVAAQTNLLALNATIEAARAGEAGRGFAVVANEVKQLAATTASSTGEITSTLAALERDVAAMAAMITEMTDGVAGIGRETAELTDVAAVQRSGMGALDVAMRGALARIEAMSSVTDRLERRAHERIAVDGTATLRRGDASGTATLLDVSEGGLRCILDEMPGVHEGSSVDVELSFGSRREVLQAVVVREVPVDQGRELGLEFRDPGEHGRQVVREFVRATLGDAP